MKTPKIYRILPKLLHNTKPNEHISVKTHPVNSDFYYFLDTRMDFYFRKMLKHNNINYHFDRKRKCLTVNEKDSPFRFFMIFDENSNYITVRKIPLNDFEYKINAISIEGLINKMVRYNIIYPRHLQRLIVPIEQKAEQLKLIGEFA